MFTDQQNKDLAAPLNAANVKGRSQGGRTVNYIEGWKVIEEANRIFGFDGWTRETVDLKCVAERERTIGQQQKPGWGVSYIAKARIVVFATDTLVTREGVGTGHGIDVDLGQAHESAIKEAETDAMKRALMTFGYQFGLALYDKTQEHVADEDKPAPRAKPAPTNAELDSAAIASDLIRDLRKMMTTHGLYEWGEIHRDKISKLTSADQERVRGEYSSRNRTLKETESKAA